MAVLSDLPASAKYTIITQAVWAIFGKVVLFYAPLYMQKMGLTAVEIGLISTCNLLFSFAWQFMASGISNKLGRKRTIFLFDLICWSVPMFIWAFAQNFWFFMAASIINATVKVSSIAWYCLLSEDVEEKKRAKVFGIMNVVMAAPGILMPAAGMLMGQYGIIPTIRAFYLLGAISMTISFFIRNAYIRETRVGLELMEKHRTLSFAGSFKAYFFTVLKAYKNRSFVIISLLYVIVNFTTSMGFVQVLYLQSNLGFGEEAISLTQVITAVVNLVFFLLLIPRLRNVNEEKTLAGSLAVCAAGAIFFIFLPEKNLFAMLMAITISAIGNYLMATYRDAVLINKLGDHEKSDMLSAVQVLTALVCIPSSYIAGVIFSVNALLPFVVIAALFVIALLISLTLIKENFE